MDISEYYEWWNDDEFVAELDRRAEDLKSGKDKGFALEESLLRLKDKSKREILNELNPTQST
jgi:hypothetical protein